MNVRTVRCGKSRGIELARKLALEVVILRTARTKDLVNFIVDKHHWILHVVRMTLLKLPGGGIAAIIPL